jgi:hypothetical protein
VHPPKVYACTRRKLNWSREIVQVGLLATHLLYNSFPYCFSWNWQSFCIIIIVLPRNWSFLVPSFTLLITPRLWAASGDGDKK